MSDKLPAHICTVPLFDDGDKAVGGGCLLVMLALFAFASFCREEAMKPPPKSEAENHTVTVCSGCGSEWESFDDKPSDPITKCPNCPMSDEEFEALKEAARKRLRSGG